MAGIRRRCNLIRQGKSQADFKQGSAAGFGYYSGTPNPDALKKHFYEEGEVGLGGFDVEFPIGSSARIDKVTVKQDAFAQTDGKTPMVLVNVVSARKSFKNNLLDCGIFEDRLDKIEEGRIPIACKLIGE